MKGLNGYVDKNGVASNGDKVDKGPNGYRVNGELTGSATVTKRVLRDNQR